MINVNNIHVQNNEAALFLMYAVCYSKELKTFNYFSTYPHLHEIRHYKEERAQAMPHKTYVVLP